MIQSRSHRFNDICHTGGHRKCMCWSLPSYIAIICIIKKLNMTLVKLSCLTGDVLQARTSWHMRNDEHPHVTN